MAETTHLGSFLRECRTGLKYTSRDVARLSENRTDIPSISNSYLISVENGKHIPRLDKVIALADLLNVPITHLVDRCREDIGRPPEPPATDFTEILSAALTSSSRNEHGRALELFRQAQVKARQLNGAVPRDQLHTLRLRLANTYRKMKITRVAKDEIESLLREPDLATGTKAYALFYLAEVHRDDSNSTLGLLIAREALRQAQAAADAVLEAKILSTLGKLTHDEGNNEEALRLFRDAASKLKALGEDRSALLARIRQGLLLVVRRDYHKAIDLLRTELTDCRENDPYVRGSLHIGLAKAYFGAENYRSARTHARAARDCADKLEDPSLQFVSTFYLWRIARRDRAAETSQALFDKLRYFRNKLDTPFDEVTRFDQYLKVRGDRDPEGAVS